MLSWLDLVFQVGIFCMLVCFSVQCCVFMHVSHLSSSRQEGSARQGPIEPSSQPLIQRKCMHEAPKHRQAHDLLQSRVIITCFVCIDNGVWNQFVPHARTPKGYMLNLLACIIALAQCQPLMNMRDDELDAHYCLSNVLPWLASKFSFLTYNTKGTYIAILGCCLQHDKPNYH